MLRTVESAFILRDSFSDDSIATMTLPVDLSVASSPNQDRFRVRGSSTIGSLSPDEPITFGSPTRPPDLCRLAGIRFLIDKSETLFLVSFPGVDLAYSKSAPDSTLRPIHGADCI